MGTFLVISIWSSKLNIACSYIGGGVDILNGLRDFRADTVTLNKCDCVFALIRRSQSVFYFTQEFQSSWFRLVLSAYIVALGSLELGHLLVNGGSV